MEDSPWKALQVLRMLRQHKVHPSSVCEIGCGAGGILHALQRDLPNVEFVGYEVSPQAHALSAPFESRQCHFVLDDAFDDPRTYDVALAMDVIEHVEDCFDFMRKVKNKALLKLYHIPLDAYVNGILRGANSWEGGGHLHLFTMETALKSVERSGQQVIDSFLTRGAPLRKNLRDQLRGVTARLLPPKLAARLLGGSLLVLAR
jgi:SAM-dependent methyltransferase